MPAIEHRYLAALPRGHGKVFLSWRLLAADAPAAPFTVERRQGDTWQPVADQAITQATSCLVQAPHTGLQEYRITGPHGTPSETVRVDAGAEPTCVVRRIPLDPQNEGYQSLVVGDLQNHGRLGYIVRSARGHTVRFTAYGHEGDFLWEHDTHLPARGGWDGSMHHVPFLAYDVNGDGRTEVAFHTFAGTYPKSEYDTGIEGERMTVLDGETGAFLWHASWPAEKSRVMMTVGHLRGLEAAPHLVVQDETYGGVVLTALDGRHGAVTWRIEQARPAGHNLDIADLDGDGVQEVVCGGVCYAGDGTRRWDAEEFGHTDISKPCRIDPDQEGMQIWYAVESRNPGVYLVDKDGRTLWKEPFKHAHYGWIARHAPRVPGLHPHAAEDSRREAQGHYPIFLPDGSHWLNLTDWQRKNFVPVHWDESPEVVFVIRKENKRLVRLLASGQSEDLPEGKLPEEGEYGRNLACVDVLGDYRENIVTLAPDRHELLVLMNPTPATRRGRSPWQDFEYRHDRSQLGSGYYIYLSPPVTTVNGEAI